MTLCMGCYNDNFSIAEVVEEVRVPVTVRSRDSTMVLKYGLMRFNGHDSERTMVVVIDYKNEERAHADSLPLGGFNSQICYDYADEATRVAKEFCSEKGWQINREVNHWPILQFIVTVP